MILQKWLKAYTSRRAELLIIRFFFLLSSAILYSNDLFWHFWLSKSPFSGVSLEKSSFGGVALGSGEDSSSFPEKHLWLQFPQKLQGGMGNLYSGSFYPLKK